MSDSDPPSRSPSPELDWSLPIHKDLIHGDPPKDYYQIGDYYLHKSEICILREAIRMRMEEIQDQHNFFRQLDGYIPRR